MKNDYNSRERSEIKQWLLDLYKNRDDSGLLDSKVKEIKGIQKKYKSGQRVAIIRRLQFRRWIRDCFFKERWPELINPKTSMLNRSLIVEENGFSSTAQLRQNPGIKLDLELLEEVLSDMGIIRIVKKHANIKNSLTQTIDRKSIAIQDKIIDQLKGKNAELEVKLSEYKKENKRLLKSKNQNDIIYEIMVETGRVPRP